MSPSTRRTLAALWLSALPSLADRPPPRQHAAPELFAGGDARSPGARFLSTLPAETREAVLRDGQAVLPTAPGSDEAGLLRAVIRFDRPSDEVFALLTQPSAQASYLPNVTQSKTVGIRTDEGETTDMVVSFVFTFRYRTQHWFYPQSQRMEWSLDPSGGAGLSEQAGFFQLYALDEKTTVAEYGTRVVARDGFLNFLRGMGERGAVVAALTATRRYVGAPSRLAVRDRR